MTREDVVNLMSLAATFTVHEDAIQNLESAPFDDVELDALALLDEDHRMRLVARLVEIAEVLREASRELDGRVLQLVGDATLLSSEQGS